MRVLLIVALVFLLVSLAVSARAKNLLEQGTLWTKRGLVGANIGFFGKGALHIDDKVLPTDPGFTFGAKFDLRLRKEWFWGFAVDIHRLHVMDTGQFLFDLSLNLKRMFFFEYSQVGFRPGIGLGMGHLSHFRTYESTTYLTSRVTLEIIFFSEANTAPFLEVGLFGGPTGGNSAFHARLTPMLLGRIGLLM